MNNRNLGPFFAILAAIDFFVFGSILAANFIPIHWANLVGILFVIIFFTKENHWGPIDLLFLRHFVVFVGISSFLATFATGLFLSSSIVGVSGFAIISAGMKTVPVYLTAIVGTIATVYFHKRQIQKSDQHPQ